MNKTEIWNVTKQLIFQTIPVIIGVYLGLIANEFSQNRKEQERSKVLKERIWNEINENRTVLEQVLPYHKMLMDSSNALLISWDGNSIPEKPNYWRGFSTSKLKESAYQTALLTGALTNFSVEEIEIISKIYTKQSGFNDFITQSIHNLSNKDMTKEEERISVISFINMATTDLFYIENELLIYYSNAEQLIGKKKK